MCLSMFMIMLDSTVVNVALRRSGALIRRRS
jgi:hypothetical protein